MHISYDPEVDALLIEFREATAVEGVDIEDGVTAALDAAGHIVALEILDARERFGGDPLDSVILERLIPEAAAQPR